jgi:glutaredoxin 2
MSQRWTKVPSNCERKGGKLQFPFLIDENTGDQLFESQDIIHHLLNIMGKLEKRQRNIAIIQKSLCLSLQEHF